jgi:hypothetical protein
LNQLKKSQSQRDISFGGNLFSSEARNQNLKSERNLEWTDRPETQKGELLNERAVNGTVGGGGGVGGVACNEG